MDHLLDTLDPAYIGARVRSARTLAQKTQAELADAVGLSRTTIVAVESGRRNVSFEELTAIAEALHTSFNKLLRQSTAAPDFSLQFRRSHSAKTDSALAASLAEELQQLAHQYIDIEEAIGRPLQTEAPLLFGITGHSLERQAEDLASLVRSRLGVGIAAIASPIQALEAEFGLRIFIRPLDSRVAGVFAFDKTAGACILINSKHPRTRRNWTCVHELGHYMTNRIEFSVDWTRPVEIRREETFVDLFASYFLMPPSLVRRHFSSIHDKTGQFTPRSLIYLADYFKVSTEAACRHLERLGYLANGTFDMLVEQGMKSSWLRRDEQELFPDGVLRSTAVALRAFDEGLLTEGQLADFLALDRLDVRRLVRAFSLDDL